MTFFTVNFDSVCGNSSLDWALWSNNVTWTTNTPDVTLCFEATVLQWIPCGFFWLTSPFYIPYLTNKESKQRREPSKLNNLKIGLCLVLLLLAIIESGKAISIHSNGNSIVPLVLHLKPIVQMVTMIPAIIIIRLELIKGIHSSGWLFSFWFLEFASYVIIFASQIIRINKAVHDAFYITTSILSSLVVFMQFFAHCFADQSAINPSNSGPGERYALLDEHDNISCERKCPEVRASFLSRITFAWITEFVIRGYRRDLTENDVWELRPQDKCDYIVPNCEYHWQGGSKKTSDAIQQTGSTNGYHFLKIDQSNNKVMDDSFHLLKPVQNDEKCTKKTIRQPSFLMVLCKVFGCHYVFIGCMKLISESLVFIQPQLLKKLINFISTGSPYKWHGYAIAIALFLVGVMRSVFFQQNFLGSYILGMRLRTATISLVYRKALKLSGAARKSTSVGEIVNLMSVDAQKLQDMPRVMHNMWVYPLVICVAMFFLWQELGPSSLASVALLTALIPVNGYLATQIERLQVTQMSLKDQRIKMMNEVLNGIKVLKLNAWEFSFSDKISKIRDEELRYLRKAALIDVISAVTWFCTPFLVALLSFTIFVLSSPENILTSEKAFVSLSLFNIIHFPLAMLPWSTTVAIQFCVSMKRLDKYFTSDELDPQTVLQDPTASNAIRIDDGSFSWDGEMSPTLTDISIQVPEGRLYAVVGAVGSGKSSLISAILGEMQRSTGRITLKGRVAYVPQQAWCQNCSLMDNILFSREMRQSKYDSVIDACALNPDLKVLPAGDRTEIGEKGINLSGGQKQRVSLARAVYQDADIYLLDDPLSAVDSHVGKHLFDRVISDTGLLANKTRVLVTHGINFLSKVDCILVMKDGRISEMGTYDDLRSTEGPFAELLRTYLAQDAAINDNDNDEPNDVQMLAMSDSSVEKARSRSISGSNVDDIRRRRSHHRRHSSPADLQFLIELEKDKEKLITLETPERGSVKLSVYINFIKALTYKVLVVLMLSYIAFMMCQVSTNFWLSVWSDDRSVANNTEKRDMYLSVYVALGAGQTIFILFESLSITYGSFLASRSLHLLLLKNILRTPMSFFDTTPTGRILNRFGKDTDTVDLNIPTIVRDWLSTLANILTTLIVVSIASPMFLVALIPLAICYVFSQRVYVSTVRQLKRIDAVKRSPIYSHFQESLVGATSIRAYKRENDFISYSDHLVDLNQEIVYAITNSNRWVSSILQTIGNIIILLAAVFAVSSRTSIGAGLAGASVSYSLQVTTAFSYFVRMTCELESNIVSVERILEFAEVESEAPLVLDYRPSESWPSEGQIEFREYSVRYRPGLDLVLRGINATINPGERVGIVGRTGAGKSSLTMGLFRILEPASGDILIDGISVQDVGLHDLRSRMTIIPQDPVLFSGSIRMNLDPQYAYSDSAVWTALGQVHLKSFVKTMPDGLDYQCSEGGENLSVGQRQLVCLARALLRRTKVLVLDEATAAIDLETDDLIQNTIRREFKGSTILTIAHRLNTIMDYDRVMIFDKGEMKEMDSPTALLERVDSIFYSMCGDAGLV